MPNIRKFRDLPDWQEVRKTLRDDVGLDPNVVAEIGEQEGDSLDLVMTTMALEEAFERKLKKKG
jgi:acyl carrier protein